MAFPSADVTIRPGENGGPAVIVVNDNAAGSRTGTPGAQIGVQNFWNQGVALPDERDVAKDLATARKYESIVTAIQAGRGVAEDTAGTHAGAVLFTIGNNTSGARAFGPFALAVDDDDRPATLTIRGVANQRRPFGTIKVLV